MCGIIIAAFFSVLVNIIVNPKGLGPTWISQTGEKFYEESVTMNIEFYLLIYLAIIGGLCILSIGVMLPATKEDIDAEVNNENLIPSQEDDKEKNNNEVPDNKKVQVPHKLSENENNYENMPDHFKQEDFDDTRSLQKTKKTALLSATTSCKMFLYFLVMLLLALYPVTALMTFTLFGYKHNISDVSLSWGLFIYLLMWGVSCPLWALFYSNFKYSYAIYLICAIQLGLGASFYFAVESTVAFLMVVGVSGVGMGFIHQIYPIHLQAIFGFENGIFCFSYATISLPIAGLIGTFLYNYIEHNLKGQYTLWMYGISAVINVLIAFMALVIKEKKFKYDDAY